MKRRAFLRDAGLGAAGMSVTLPTSAAGRGTAGSMQRTFNLDYAPHFGMFVHHAGEDLVDQIEFMAEVGFRAIEDNGMRGRPVAVQESVARAMERHGMRMGVFVAHDIAWSEPALASGAAEPREKFLQDVRASVDVAKRVNATWMTVVPGALDPRLEMDYQTANVIEALRRAADILEPHNLVMVLEPLNPYRDHPGLFLSKAPQAYLICRAVDSPSCKILFDIYHQQITEGNLIPNIDMAWDEIAYFQIGDNPGRNEPTTGEINYRNVFAHIHELGWDGILGMEHGKARPGKEGEEALIEAYVHVDSFL